MVGNRYMLYPVIFFFNVYFIFIYIAIFNSGYISLGRFLILLLTLNQTVGSMYLTTSQCKSG